MKYAAVLACSALVAAAPLNGPQTGPVKIPLSTRNRYVKRVDGTVNVPLLYQTVNRTLNKYHAKPLPSGLLSNLKKRATASEALVDQVDDGVDELYYGTVTVGASNPQTFTVDFDTGSSDFFVPGPSCGTAQGCVGTTKYDQDGTDEHNTTSVTYGSGSVEGENYFDTVCFQSLCAPHTNVVSLTTATGFSGSDSEGLLGLAFQSIAQSGQPTLIDNLISEGKLSSPEFSFFLGRAASGTQGKSELTVGGADSSRYTGSFTTVPVSSQTYWQVALGGVFVGGTDAPLTAGQAAIDTGTTVVLAPTVSATSIYAQLGGFPVPLLSGSPTETVFVYPCNTKKTVAIEFAGKQFAINPKDFDFGSLSSVAVEEFGSPSVLTSLTGALSNYCVGAIFGGDIDPEENLYVVGDTFLKNWYTTFYKGSTPTVNFAVATGEQ